MNKTIEERAKEPTTEQRIRIDEFIDERISYIEEWNGKTWQLLEKAILFGYSLTEAEGWAWVALEETRVSLSELIRTCNRILNKGADAIGLDWERLEKAKEVLSKYDEEHSKIVQSSTLPTVNKFREWSTAFTQAEEWTRNIITEEQFKQMVESIMDDYPVLRKLKGIPYEKWSSNIHRMVDEKLGIERKTVIVKHPAPPTVNK